MPSQTKLAQNARNASSAYNSKRYKASRFDHLLWGAINKNTSKRNNLANVTQSGENVKLTGTTASTSVSNGALVVDGGVGIAKQLNVDGDTTFYGTASVSKVADTLVAGTSFNGLSVQPGQQTQAASGVHALVTCAKFTGFAQVAGAGSATTSQSATVTIENATTGSVSAANDFALLQKGANANSKFEGTLNVVGAATLGSTLAVSGAATLDSTLAVKGLTSSLGSRKFQSFVGTFASTNAATNVYADGDCLVELGTLDDTSATGLVAGSQIFVHKAVVLITTAAGATLVGNLALSSTTGTLTNAAVVFDTEIVGADVISVNPRTSAPATVAEIDINFDAVAAHVFAPNLAVILAKKYLYVRSTTAINTGITAGLFSVELEYSIL